MRSEFSRSWFGHWIKSSNGFAIQILSGGGIKYIDRQIKVGIELEWMGKKNGIILYRRSSHKNKVFKKLDEARIDEILANATRALEFLGYIVEIV